ncbi:MAG: hypothetical protein JO171_01405 [Paludibacterium sp.]|uniref:hypothetical protein n=1 Tax=Paludibacterium sp. TaxID=1917523 RepID=UPI0025E97D66|nr:hypothetical protein [Paludibacterium sp.]MBV8045782.1 hypothetical protein [Paludibacterium sp.]MBV8647053.1 hypothetical protein [Paludibacterium sp.]
MPYVHLQPDGAIDALYLHPGDGRAFLSLSDFRVLRFLQASDSALATALLNASDDAHHLLLAALIDLLVRKKALSGQKWISERDLHLPHRQLNDLTDTVETSEDEAQKTLSDSDRNAARITEDVIDALIARKIIRLDDLPPAAQHLLAIRRALRVYLADTADDLDEV